MEHPTTLASMAHLASTYRNQSRWEEAEELSVEVLALQKEALGERHPDTIRSITELDRARRVN
ncbi:hypothetical protein B0O99DRAFT_716306 [Bisporella sp. PMI_857]|nr:hypothetical protein B0O99DRAFT_716306 [Bisporella sp. PMI_857]